jgi:hypothetical protein
LVTGISKSIHLTVFRDSGFLALFYLNSIDTQGENGR